MTINFLTGMAVSDGGGGGGGGGGACGSDPIPERSQKIGFHSKTGPDPLKNRRATRPEFNVSALSGRQ